MALFVVSNGCVSGKEAVAVAEVVGDTSCGRAKSFPEVKSGFGNVIGKRFSSSLFSLPVDPSALELKVITSKAGDGSYAVPRLVRIMLVMFLKNNFGFQYFGFMKKCDVIK